MHIANRDRLTLIEETTNIPVKGDGKADRIRSQLQLPFLNQICPQCAVTIVFGQGIHPHFPKNMKASLGDVNVVSFFRDKYHRTVSEIRGTEKCQSLER